MIRLVTPVTRNLKVSRGGVFPPPPTNLAIKLSPKVPAPTPSSQEDIGVSLVSGERPQSLCLVYVELRSVTCKMFTTVWHTFWVCFVSNLAPGNWQVWLSSHWLVTR